MREIPQNMDLFNLISGLNNETKDERAPFLIRGHHLRFYHILLNERVNPEMMARYHVNEWQKKQKEFQEASVQNPHMKERVAYFKDLLGETPEEHTLFTQKYQKTLEQFMQIPDNYPVEIVQKPDAICASCIGGDHCTLIRQAYGDSTYLTIFKSENEKKKRHKPLIIIHELVDFSDQGMRLTNAILTDKSTVKRILLTTPYSLWEQQPHQQNLQTLDFPNNTN